MLRCVYLDRLVFTEVKDNPIYANGRPQTVASTDRYKGDLMTYGRFHLRESVVELCI